MSHPDPLQGPLAGWGDGGGGGGGGGRKVGTAGIVYPVSIPLVNRDRSPAKEAHCDNPALAT